MNKDQSICDYILNQGPGNNMIYQALCRVVNIKTQISSRINDRRESYKKNVRKQEYTVNKKVFSEDLKQNKNI
ncbi:MAG: hypothetical protein IPO98_00875 [Saprospiraceae bacterium]|nr:hypothetical protein [Saprospiraceae bacterium]